MHFNLFSREIHQEVHQGVDLPQQILKGLNNKHKCLRQLQRNLSEEDSYEEGQKKQQWNKKVHTKKQGNV